MSKSHLLPIFSPLPVCFQKGEGVWLTDTQGNVYLDGFAGIAVNAVGHNHPRLVSALQKQVSELIHVSNYFRIDLQEEVAAKLCEKADCAVAFSAIPVSKPTRPPSSLPGSMVTSRDSTNPRSSSLITLSTADRSRHFQRRAIPTCAEILRHICRTSYEYLPVTLS